MTMRRFTLAALMACALGSAASAATAQVRIGPGVATAIHAPDTTLTERVYALEKQNADLQAQIALLQQAIDRLHDATVKGQAETNSTVAAYQNGNGQQFGVIDGQIKGLSQKLDDLANKFAWHKHSYKGTGVQFHNVLTDPGPSTHIDGITHGDDETSAPL